MAGDKENPSGSGQNTDVTTSPLYIHPSDYPKQMHVNDALTDSNYSDWSQEMLNFLLAKNKIGFIDGSIEKPENTDADYTSWMRCDAMVKGWLTAAMEKEVRNSVKYAATANEIWVDLVERFGKESAPRAYEVKQTLSNTQQNGTSVSTYYTKMRSLWDEMQSALSIPHCTCHGCKCDIAKRMNQVRDKEQLYEFLMGLDNEFSVIRTQILAMNPLPTLRNAYHLVHDDEKQRAITAEKKVSNEPAAFKAFVPGRRDNTGPKRYKPPAPKEDKRTDVVAHCTFCGKDGHSRDSCFKRVGYPDWWPGNKKREDGKPKYWQTRQYGSNM